DYGDGSGTHPLTLKPDHTFDLSHVYDDNGTYPVTVTVTDDDLGAGSASFDVNVSNVAPTITAIVPSSPAVEGSPVYVSLGVNEPSNADFVAGLTYAWSVTRGGAPYASGTGPVVFTPDDNGDYAVTVSATDKDGGTGTRTGTVSVL